MPGVAAGENLKGFRTAIPVYEVPWREAGDSGESAGGTSTGMHRESDTSFQSGVDHTKGT